MEESGKSVGIDTYESTEIPEGVPSHDAPLISESEPNHMQEINPVAESNSANTSHQIHTAAQDNILQEAPMKVEASVVDETVADEAMADAPVDIKPQPTEEDILNASEPPAKDIKNEFPETNPETAPVEDTEMVIPQAHEIVIPSYSKWFNLNKIHEIERQSLPEFFTNRIASKTPQVYLKYRNFIVNSYRLNPNEYFSVTSARRNMSGDAATIFRVHKFLMKWGLINYQVDAKLLPKKVEPPYTGDFVTRHDAPRGLFPFESYKPSVQLPNMTKLKKMIDVADSATSLNDGTASSPGMGTRKRSNDLNSNDGTGEKSEISNDIKRPRILEAIDKDWTREDIKNLIDGIRKHHNDWYQIAKTVGNKTPEQCILRFLQLPTEDKFLHHFVEDSENNAVDNLGPLKYAPHLPFSKSENPILSTLAFLVGLVDPVVVQNMTDRAIVAIESLKMKVKTEPIKDEDSTAVDSEKNENVKDKDEDKENTDLKDDDDRKNYDHDQDKESAKANANSIDAADVSQCDASSDDKRKSTSKGVDSLDDKVDSPSGDKQTIKIESSRESDGNEKDKFIEENQVGEKDEKGARGPIGKLQDLDNSSLLRQTSELAISALGARSHIFASNEEQQLNDVANKLIEVQFQKIEKKLSLIDEIEKSFALQKRALERQQEQLTIEKLAFAKHSRIVNEYFEEALQCAQDQDKLAHTLTKIREQLASPTKTSLGRPFSGRATGPDSTSQESLEDSMKPVSLVAPQLYRYWSA